MSEPTTPAWPEVSALLDALIDLEPAGQEAELSALHATHPVLAARVRALLASARAADAAGFLDTMPAITTADAGGAAHHQPQDCVGPWRLRSLLGHGGMAEVWLAHRDDGLLERQVALKLPLPGYGTGRLGARFARERDILSALNHPHIARLYDAGVDEQGQPWLALEHVSGANLIDWCDSRQLGMEQRLALFLQIGSAVQYAHGQLVIHRDLKPGNVRVNDDGQVRLLDFGIAQLLDADDESPALTAAGASPLSLEGASPEQVRGERPGVASDIYALGLLLYRLLTSVSPYEPTQPGRQALAHCILHQTLRRPSERVIERAQQRRLRGDLDTIILKATDKAPDRRYATVEALVDDVSRHLRGEPVLARRPSTGYRLSRFVSRHKIGVAAGVLAVAALLGMTGEALYQARTAGREAARNQALYQFVLGVFNPRGLPIPDTRSRNMPAHELVALAADRVTSSMPDQPQARFQLMHDLAALTTSLGMADAASKLHEARLAQSLALMGKDSPEYADALLDRTSDLEGQGRYPDAYRDAKQALAIYTAAGESSPDRLARAHYQVAAFGMHSHAAGDADDLMHLQTAASLWRGRYGKSEFGSVMERMTQYYLLLNRNEDAYRAARDGMENNLRQFGELDWKTAAAEEQTGLMLSTLLRPAEGEPLLRKALATQQAIWGEGHFLVARSQMYLGNLLAASSHHDEAAALLRSAQASIHAEQWRGNKVVLTGFIDASNADLHDKWGDPSEALSTCEPYFAQMPPLQAPVHVRLDLVCTHAAAVAGRMDAASRMLDDATHTVAANWPNDPARMAPVWRRRGEVMQMAGDVAGATHAYTEALKLADGDDLDTLSGAWLDLARVARAPLDDNQRAAVVQLLARMSAASPGDYYALYVERLRESLGGTAIRENGGKHAI
ncbi:MULTISPECIES: serine/threonine-protein kinase [unclassified Dyella]|uniref:serine/threonine-protein kinase n=1 Tax=unclassified Dyella TaxID=2634549 RepID=UPI000C838DA0|nr:MULTISPECIES: serine/threonine-protein kinase [unclassified Dyella]MDR3445839.1 serine/threonine-protein kinase [Dyella sp.]PMQ04353.1 Serine/threonine-protein kinase StkP [Dyella sp. AD56]